MDFVIFQLSAVPVFCTTSWFLQESFRKVSQRYTYYETKTKNISERYTSITKCPTYYCIKYAVSIICKIVLQVFHLKSRVTLSNFQCQHKHVVQTSSDQWKLPTRTSAEELSERFPLNMTLISKPPHFANKKQTLACCITRKQEKTCLPYLPHNKNWFKQVLTSQLQPPALLHDQPLSKNRACFFNQAIN